MDLVLPYWDWDRHPKTLSKSIQRLFRNVRKKMDKPLTCLWISHRKFGDLCVHTRRGCLSPGLLALFLRENEKCILCRTPKQLTPNARLRFDPLDRLFVGSHLRCRQCAEKEELQSSFLIRRRDGRPDEGPARGPAETD
jgi:hypothetical protein